ncbi:geobacillin-26 family protein [Mycoplasmatota bacterium]|nr:geobacillin-26 family protein [Mycoplasmatota bacterium]
MKKIFSYLILLVLSITLVSVSASESRVQIITDNQNVRVVKGVEGDIITYATYNKIANTLEYTEYTKGDKENSVTTLLNLNNVNIPIENDSITTMGTSIEQKTYSNYEYKITFGSPNHWELRRPQPGSWTSLYYFTTYERSDLLTDLNNFRNTVEDIDDLEKEIIFYGGVAIIGTVLLLIFTSGTSAGLQAALASAGIFGVVADLTMDLDRAIDDAYYYYFRVYNAK